MDSENDLIDIKDQNGTNLSNGYTPKSLSKKETIFYGFGPLADQMSHQMFQFLIFTYYYAWVQIDVTSLAIAFIIFAIWDAFNDPIIGVLTDKTKAKIGKRKIWIIISLIPFALINVFLFTPPFFFTGSTELIPNLVYMIIIVILYDTFYSFYSVSSMSLFSEMFITEDERGYANTWTSAFTIIGVIIGFVIPTIIIPELAPDENTSAALFERTPSLFVWTGVMTCILVILFGFIFIKFGIREDRHHYYQAGSIDVQTGSENVDVGLFQMVRDTITNKNFLIFCGANLIKWTVFKLLTTIVPLWATHNLGVEGIMISVVLVTGFLAAIIFFPVMKIIGSKIGWRNGLILSQIVWCFSLIPFWFMDGHPFGAMTIMLVTGFGLSGAVYFIEPIVAMIIDEDELRTGKAKAGSYYGINGLINRFSTILVFSLIALVLDKYGWAQYLVGADADYASLEDGLRLLLVPISMVGIIFVILFLSIFSLHGKKWTSVQKELEIARIQRIN